MPDHAELPDQGGALLAFFLGPAQPFIAGARTVRDLWTGSYLLAWLTFAAIRTLDKQDASLVSPSLPERHPLWWTIRKEGKPPLELTTPCIPNRFIARLRPGVDAHDLARKCEKACHDCWDEICRQVRARIGDKIDQARAQFRILVNGRQVDLLAAKWDRLWDTQVGSFFEVRTAVLFPGRLTEQLFKGLLDPAPQGDRAALDVLFGLMDARKSVRHVPDYAADGDVPQKCTLLGTYEQMGPAQLEESRRFWEAFAERVHIDGTRVRKGERLCAVSLVKRFAWPAHLNRPEGLGVNDVRQLHYSDTATVAAKCWLAADPQRGSEPLDPKLLRDEYGNWNGQWLHWPTQHFDRDEKRCPDDVWRQIREKRHAQGNPPTYYAILMADADRLGDTMAAKGARVSQALTAFAFAIRGIVEQHGGELIYSGGDDTLALLPTETTVACAHAIQRGYEENWRTHFPEDDVPGTISAGIVVVHYKEDLRFALDVAREAEHAAKHFGRNALGLAVCRRSGEHTSAVLGWGQAEGVNALVESFRGGASDRWTYKLRALLPTFEGLPPESFSAELRRLLGRVEARKKEDRETLEMRVTGLAADYLAENCKEFRKRPPDKPREAHAMVDFVTLCQSASFLARGRDAR